MLQRLMGTSTSRQGSARGAVPDPQVAPSSGQSSTATLPSGEHTASQAATRSGRTTLRSQLRKLALAAGFGHRDTRPLKPDPLEGMSEEQRIRLRKAAMTVLCDKGLLELILGRWPRLDSTGSYEQAYLTDSTASLSRTSKDIRKTLLPKLWAAFQYCQYNQVFVHTSGAPNGWLKFKGTDRLPFGYWVTEQVLPHRLPRHASVMIPVLTGGFMSERITQATQEAFQHCFHRGNLDMARRMLTSGLVSPLNSFNGVKPLFLLVQKANAAYLDEVIEGIRALECFPGFINSFDGRDPGRRLLDYAQERGNQAVIDVLRKHGAVTHDVVIEEAPPARLIVQSESLHQLQRSISTTWE